MVRGSNPGGRRDFPHPSRPTLEPPASYTMSTGSFSRVKRPGRGADRPPPSSAEVKGRVELYICFSSGPSWPVLGRTLFTYKYVISPHTPSRRRQVPVRLTGHSKIVGLCHYHPSGYYGFFFKSVDHCNEAEVPHKAMNIF